MILMRGFTDIPFLLTIYFAFVEVLGIFLVNDHVFPSASPAHHRFQPHGRQKKPEGKKRRGKNKRG